MSTSAVSQPMPHARSSSRWSGRSRGRVIGNRIFVGLVRRCGLRCAYALLVPVSFYYLLFAPSARRASCAYQRRLMGSRRRSSPVRALAELVGAYRHFYSFGRILLDRVAIAGKGVCQFRFEFEGEEYIRSALREGKGAVLVTAHVGNWEAAAHLLRRLEAPVNIVALKAEEQRLQQYFDRVIDNRHLTIIPADGSSEAALAIMAALKRGELVAIQADRFLDAQTADRAESSVGARPREEMISFLGAPARFSTGPFVTAAVAGAPLIHAFAIREGTYRYHLRAFPPERVAFGDRQERARMLREWMGLFVQRLEGTLREHPLQWLNFYDFWERKDKA